MLNVPVRRPAAQTAHLQTFNAQLSTFHPPEDHQPIPERRMTVPRGSLIQQHLITARTLREEVERAPARGVAVGVIDQHHAVRREERLGQAQSIELMLIRVRAIEIINTESLPMNRP